MEKVVLGLGSNVAFYEKNGDVSEPKKLIKLAMESLKTILSDLICSSIYLSKPQYYLEQAEFYNAVVCGFYEGSPQTLLDDIHQIEAKFGRNRKKEIRNGPRTLDIDIELFGNQIIKTNTLEIPHIRIKERAFVLKPMLEILPNLADPITGDLFEIAFFSLSEEDKNSVFKIS